jgi:hypothetical protein
MIKTTKPQTFMVDNDLGAKIQMLLITAKMQNKNKYKSISDFVNEAIKEKLKNENN